MTSNPTASLLPDEDLPFIERYMTDYIPLAVEGQHVTLDAKTFRNFLSAFFRSHPDFKQRRRGVITREQKERLKGSVTGTFNAVAKKVPFDAADLQAEVPAPKRSLLMSSPENLVNWGYNAEEKADAFRQWFALRCALVRAGAHVEIADSSYSWRNSRRIREVFTRDRYVLIGDTAYLPDPRVMDTAAFDKLSGKRGYKAEIAQVKAALKKRGVKTVTVKGAWFEGGNVVRHYSTRTIFAALDHRTTEDHVQRLIDTVNATQKEKWSALPVPLTNRDVFYHLDTGMSEELPHGEVMLYPDVTDKDTYKKICNIIGRKNIIELSDREARSMVTNMIDVGDTVIMTHNPDVPKTLSERYNVVVPRDYGCESFEIGEGGAHCMTNDIRSPRPGL